MKAYRSVLLVAADQIVRRSLQFVIESEGISVDAHSQLDAAMNSCDIKNINCLIVDEDAVQSTKSALDFFQQFATPIILLAERADKHFELGLCVPLQVLIKPLSGSLLIDTVMHLETQIQNLQLPPCALRICP